MSEKKQITARRIHVSDLKDNYDRLRERYKSCESFRCYYKKRMEEYHNNYHEMSTYEFYRDRFLFYRVMVSLLADDLRAAKERYKQANKELSMMCQNK